MMRELLTSLLQGRLVRALSSVRLGIVLGLAGAALLGVASLLLPSPRGPQALPFSESLLPFFEPVSARFWWFYGLLAVFVLFALALLLSALRTSLLRGRGGWNLHAVAVLLMHLGVLGALASHLLAGFSAGIEESGLITREGVQLAGHHLRLVQLERETHPDGSLRGVRARVLVDDGTTRVLAYNRPLFFDGLTRFVLIERLVDVPGAARFQVGADVIVVAPGERFEGEGGPYRLEAINTHPSLRAPMVQVRSLAAGATSTPAEPRWLAPGWRVTPTLRLLGLESAPVPAVLVRRNDGLPALLAASVVFCVGIALFWIASAGSRPRRT